MTRRTTIALVAVVGFLYWIGLYLYVPTLPTYVQTKTDNLAMVGTVLSMYGLWQAIIRLPLGIAADWVGRRKPFLLVCMFLLGLGCYVLGSAEGVTGLLVGRIITGLAAGTWVPLVVLFNSLFPPEETVRATALFNFIGFGGRMLATSITGTLNQIGGYSLAFYLAAGAAGLAILVALPLHERRRSPNRPSLNSLGRLASRRDVLLPSILAIISNYVAFATTFGFLPILAKQLGATDVTQSMLVSLNVALTMLSSLLVTSLVKRVGGRFLVYSSFVFTAAGTGLAAVAYSLPMIFVVQAFLGLGFGIGYSVLMGTSIQQIEDRQRTTAMGLFQSLYSIGMFAGPWVSGILADAMGIRPMLGVTTVACLVPGVLLTRLLDGRQPVARQ
jgi:DHA1 family multidrug resistance protein-like MFS transporter